jgi:hypothetical protein
MKGVYFHLSSGKQILIKPGPRIPRRLKKLIKDGRKLVFKRNMIQGMLNSSQAWQNVYQEVKITKDGLQS